VLLVTSDDAFSAAIKRHLYGVEMLSLTEGSVWTAVRGGLDVTRGVSTLVVDGDIGGLLQLRLYERLRPSDVIARVPIIFTRAKLGGGPAHDLDFYLAHDGTPEQAARLICHVLGIPIIPAGVASRFGTPQPVTEAVRRRPVRPQAAAIPPGLLQRLGLWGVGSALLGFTIWPILGSSPVRDAFHAPMEILAGGPASTTADSGR
jgi:hypothetical protein